jgi:predicted TIM-barrel fold metal-dependent hydrolase
VGWLIDQAGADLFLFSTDFPHPEGGRDPLKRFKTALDQYGIAEEQRERFYTSNFNDLLGSHA